MRTKILAAVSAIALFSNTAFGAALGTEIAGWSQKIATGTDLYKTEFISEQAGVGMQTEYYAKYTPNADVLPMVVGGNSLWGLRNIKKAEELMTEKGQNAVLGINASFFSFQTGIPMGVSIIDGIIITKDTESYETIGFSDDGSAFIAPLKIDTKLKFQDTELEISHINKFNQETTPIINLYTSDFDADNHNEIPSLTIILDKIDGKLGIGEKLSATVSDKFLYTGAVKIPDGQFLLK